MKFDADSFMQTLRELHTPGEATTKSAGDDQTQHPMVDRFHRSLVRTSASSRCPGAWKITTSPSLQRLSMRSPAFSHPRVLQVRFEDMIKDTDRFFARIYRFLEVDDTIRHVLLGPVGYDDEFVLNGQERQWIIEFNFYDRESYRF